MLDGQKHLCSSECHLTIKARLEGSVHHHVSSGGVLAGSLPFHTQSTLILEILSKPVQGREDDVLRTTTIAIAKKAEDFGLP